MTDVSARCRLAAALTLAAGLALASPAAAREMHRVPRIEVAAEIDGHLDEPAWQQALLLEPGYETDPGENVPAPVRTEVFLAYDREHLYVAFRAHDPEPERIVARLTDRDRIRSNDWVSVTLDTFDDQRRSYVFMSNPLGVQGDAIESHSGGGAGWDGIWDSAGRLTEDGYTVEMRIPFNCLGFQRTTGEQTWGIDLERHYPRDVAHMIALFPHDRDDTCVMCQSDKLVGFEGATPGRNLEITPTFSSVATQERSDFFSGDFSDADPSSELGLTANWGVTPNMTLAATVHPDFSQVEADAAQLDVNNRFALFFPEKRPFFLEGADYFSTLRDAVHTRSVADPSWGVKLTGKEGPHSLGLFVARDEITNFIFPDSQASRQGFLDEPNTATVLRYRRDLGERASTLGTLVTHREGRDYSNTVTGIDGDWRITKAWRVRAQVLGSSTSYPDDVARAYGQPSERFDGAALDVLVNYGSRDHGAAFNYQDVDADFRADLGFSPRGGVRSSLAVYRRSWWGEEGSPFTRVRFLAQHFRSETRDGQTLQNEVFVQGLYEGAKRSQAGVTVVLDGESFYRLPSAAPGEAFVRVDTSDFFEVWTHFWPTSSVFLSVYAFQGGDFDAEHARPGTATYLEGTAAFRPGRHLAIDLRHVRYTLDVDPWTFDSGTLAGELPLVLPAGELLQGDVTELKTVYQFSRRSFLRAIVQYVDYRFNPALYAAPVDERFEHVFTQLLFSYKVNPQTVIFAGTSDNRYADPLGTLRQTDRTFFLKLGYAWVL